MEMKDFAAGFAAGKAQGGGGGGEAVLINKSVSSNGTYNASTDNADGYKKVTVSVPNSYAAGDEGKVVSNGALVSQTAHAKVTQNGTIDTTLYNSVEIDVSGGGGGGEAVLINKSVSSNGTYNASTDNADGYKKVTVSVPNSYAAGDEGKVVSNGALVSQTAHAKVTQNGTIDTTLYNSVEIDVSGGGGGAVKTLRVWTTSVSGSAASVNIAIDNGEPVEYRYDAAENPKTITVDGVPAAVIFYNTTYGDVTSSGWAFIPLIEGAVTESYYWYNSQAHVTYQTDGSPVKWTYNRSIYVTMH